eukprot:5498026-Pleurochrysis_carterae.AAC.5
MGRCAGRRGAHVVANRGGGSRRSILPARKYEWTRDWARAHGRSKGENVRAMATALSMSNARCASAPAPRTARVRRVGGAGDALGGRVRAREELRAGEGRDGSEEHGADGGRAPKAMSEPLVVLCPAAGGCKAPRAARGFARRTGRVGEMSLRALPAFAGSQRVTTGAKEGKQALRRTGIDRARHRVRKHGGEEGEVEHDGDESSESAGAMLEGGPSAREAAGAEAAGAVSKKGSAARAAGIVP